MGFRDEIIKARRKIAPYIRFSKTLNPHGPWAGPDERLYGAAEDGSGPLPIKGHVLNFGSFSRSVASALFSLEIPGVTSTLVDEELDWRKYANEPYDTLIRKWIHYLLRVHDDQDLAHDATVALGQIQNVAYPPARRAQVSSLVAPPELLGAKIPRRTITLDDWPTAPPESVGRPVPILYGILNNAVEEICPETPVCAAQQLLGPDGSVWMVPRRGDPRRPWLAKLPRRKLGRHARRAPATQRGNYRGRTRDRTRGRA